MTARAATADLTCMEIVQVSELLRRRKVSPVELLDAVLANVERLNPLVNAFITVNTDEARHAARVAEQEIIKRHYRGPLHGVPISIKDNIETRGLRTTAGSKILADFVPQQDADVVRALRRAGAIIIGKTNMHEFAYGITSENPHYGAVRNPWDKNRVSGGSSGGSAVAVATGMGFASLGTDTGGSIRIPAALCGIVGLKPTFDRVSCRGVIPLSPSLDHVGPLAKSPEDAALLLEAIAKTGRALPSPFRSRTARKARRPAIRLGWPREFFFDHVDEEVQSIIEETIRAVEKSGVKVERVSLPHIADSADAGTQIALAEATHYHQSRSYFPARADDYGQDVRGRLEQGAGVRAIDYLQALAVRERVIADFTDAFRRVDAVVAPTVPIPAPLIGQKMVTLRGEEETVRSALVRMNRPANFTGHPAISIPCAITRDRLPVGLQLIGPRWEEVRLLQIASFILEETVDAQVAAQLRRPPVAGRLDASSAKSPSQNR